MNKINENIKKVRTNKRLTQQEVADGLFVTRQCISRWEQGKTLPDIKSLEKLAKLLECSINDLLDDDSVKSITLKEAISNKKKTKFIWISIIISLLAIFFTIIGIKYYGNRNSNSSVATDELHSVNAIVLEINLEDKYIKLDLDERAIFTVSEEHVFLNIEEFKDVEIFNNKFEEINEDDLVAGDILIVEYYLTFESCHITQINVIDSNVEKSLLGVIFVTNGARYETYEDIPTDGTEGIRYYLFEEHWGRSSERSNAGRFESSSEYSYEKYKDTIVLIERNFEMNIYFDELRLINDPVIGIVYSTGIEYIDDFNPSYNTSKKFEGEVDYTVPNDPFLIHSIEVTYTLHFYRVSSFSRIEVYEYDVDNELLTTSTISNWVDKFRYTVDEDAIYSYVKVFTSRPFGLGSYESFEVFKLNVGEKLEVSLSDEYGLVWKEDFSYIVNPLAD